MTALTMLKVAWSEIRRLAFSDKSHTLGGPVRPSRTLKVPRELKVAEGRQNMPRPWQKLPTHAYTH